jgi:hypothetical protein
VSFRSPQDVEVAVDGAWVPGAMLGWRVDETGGCQALVLLRDARGQETWTDLAAVRLPERHRSLTSAMSRAPAGAPGTVVMTAVGHSALLPGVRGARRSSRRHGGDVTAEQPAVVPAAAGRHRAPAGSGRHRAATAEMPVVPCPAPVLDVVAGVPTGLTVDLAADPAGRPDLLTRPIRLGDLAPSPRGDRPAVRLPA